MKTQWDNILSIGTKVLSGKEINQNEALTLSKSNGSDIFLLCSFANKIREKFNGNHVDLCSVINAKSGNCSEDCAFCSQSCHHKTNIKSYSLLDENTILNMAVQRQKSGARHCDIATSGLGYNGTEKDFDTILRAFKKMKENTNLKLCACLGVLTEYAMNKLAAVGVERYNHNLETARSFYGSIVSTHGYDERIDTIKHAKKAGMEVCSGMIIGLGETIKQRIEHSFLLRELNVDAVPVNILNPVKGTKLENAKPLPPMEILKTFAIIRFILPDKIIRYAGGREKNLRSLQPLGFAAGLNGMLIGNYLTTTGQNVNDDFNMLKDLELDY